MTDRLSPPARANRAFAVPRAARALLSATALAVAALPLSAAANETLARKHGCLGCHSMNSNMVGPAYQAVAERYAGQADAVNTLAASIRQGGSGKWGQMAMPPQAQVPAADAKRLATWVLGTAKPAAR